MDRQMSSELSGFFIQDKRGDGDPSTSDGIFVYHRDSWGFDVAKGQKVRVTGEVDEQYGMTQIESVDNVEFCGRGQVKHTKITVEEYTANAETFEGMLVRFRGKLAVSDTYNLHRYGEIWLTKPKTADQPTNVWKSVRPR